jgi:hypothetical protein
MSCLQTTRAIILSEAWPINNAQNELQVLCGRRSFSPLHFLDDPSAAKGVASVGSFVLYAAIRFRRPPRFFRTRVVRWLWLSSSKHSWVEGE